MRADFPRKGLLWLCTGLVALSPACAANAVTRKGLVFADVGGRQLRLDLFLPKTLPPARGYPLIISIHGGGWLFGNRGKDVFLKSFTDRGCAIASIDYRLSGTAPFPAQIEDCRAALRWLIGNASRLGLDPRRIGVTGASAGGHLALLLGMADASGKNPVRAICAFYPPTDLVGIIPADRRTHRDNLVAQLLGGPVASHLALARAGSPLTYAARNCPPILLIHGDRDGLVPIEQSKTLWRALREAGAPAGLVICAGKGHAFGPTPAVTAMIAAFFDRALGP